jgi:hypothetical protein
MTDHDLQALHRHINAANAIVEKLLGHPSDTYSSDERNPAFFRNTGHLSDAGIKAIYQLFEDGCTIEEAAKRMSISFRGAAQRRQAWKKNRNRA